MPVAHAHPHSHRQHVPNKDRKRDLSNGSVHHLFSKRQQGNYPASDVFGPTPLQSWIDSYDRAVTAGLIPNIPPAANVNAWPAYPEEADMDEICSWTISKCEGANDIYEAPDNEIGISFDDGPQPPSAELYDFLQANNVTATHFMIGSRIVDNPDLFDRAVAMGGELAVHTWAHPLLSTMTDHQILGELGWCMQIIADHADGRIPSLVRPPYGDYDNRVRAIAENVFGLQAVIWNHDSDDWCLTDGGGSACSETSGITTDQELSSRLTEWLSGPKSPGLVILQHELSDRAVNGFVDVVWPLIQSEGWVAKGISDMFASNWYQNAIGPSSPILPLEIGSSALPLVSSSTLSSSSTSTSSSTSAATSLATTSRTLISAPSSTSLSGSSSVLPVPSLIGTLLGSVLGVAGLLLLAAILVRRRKNRRGYLNTGSPRTSETMRFLGSDTDLSTSASRTSGQYPFYAHSSNSSVSLSNYTDVRSSSPAPPLRPSTPNSEQVFYPSSPRKVLASSVGASNSGRSVARDVVRSAAEDEVETRHVRIRSYDGPLPISSHSPRAY